MLAGADGVGKPAEDVRRRVGVERERVLAVQPLPCRRFVQRLLQCSHLNPANFPPLV
jgi:hypothetical protein